MRVAPSPLAGLSQTHRNDVLIRRELGRIFDIMNGGLYDALLDERQPAQHVFRHETRSYANSSKIGSALKKEFLRLCASAHVGGLPIFKRLQENRGPQSAL